MLSVGFVKAGVGFGNGCFMVGYEVVFLFHIWIDPTNVDPSLCKRIAE